MLQPVDPLAVPGVVRTHLDSEGDKDDQTALASQLSQPSELTQPSSTGNPPRGGERLGFCRLLIKFMDQGVFVIHHYGCSCFVSAIGGTPPPPTNPPVVLIIF